MSVTAEVDGKRVEWDGEKWNRIIPTCPDCGEEMVKASIECEDKSGWYCAWLCGCEVKGEG